VIAVVLLAGVVASAAALAFSTKIYKATATIRVATGVGGTDVLRAEDLSFSDRLINTYKELAESKPLRRAVQRRTASSGLPDVKVELPANTELLLLSVEAPSPRLAQREANALAQLVVLRARELADSEAQSTDEIFRIRLGQMQREAEAARKRLAILTASGGSPDEVQALKDEIKLKEESRQSLLQQSTTAQSGAISRASTVSIGEAAGLPASPAKPRPALTIALGIFLGLVGGVGLAFLRENLDRRIYSREEVGELTGAPVLASIPTGPGQRRSVFNSASPQQDAFARLRTNLTALNGSGQLKTVMVTSAEPGAGKSTVVANLAAALARDGAKVVAVDADLRLPTLHMIFGLPNNEGLSTLLSGRRGHSSSPMQFLLPTEISNLAVLPSGPEVEDPAERLGSERMREVLATLGKDFDVVIVDTPALLSVSDAANLVGLMDSVLLITREGHSTRQGVRDAREQLEAVNVKGTGVVVNCSRQSPASYYSAYQKGRQLWR
jgi:non-specific protein-tyrosine kinase